MIKANIINHIIKDRPNFACILFTVLLAIYFLIFHIHIYLYIYLYNRKQFPNYTLKSKKQQYNLIANYLNLDLYPPYSHIAMINSRSHSNIGRRVQPQVSQKFLDYSPSNRTFYINDEVAFSKDIATTFHSPYKDGKRNKQFTNPTFMSSNIFYGQQQTKRELTPKHNLVYNRNQKQRKQLYNNRIQKADKITQTIHQVAYNDLNNRSKSIRKVNEQSQQPIYKSISKSQLRVDKGEQLSKQLQNLLKYREDKQKKRIQASRKILNDVGSIENVDYQRSYPSTPIYIQKNRIQNQQKLMAENKKNLKQWMAISSKIKKLKDQANINFKKSQTKAMDNYIITNTQKVHQKQLQSRRNATMLANILRQQIKQSQARKEKYKRQNTSMF